MDSREHIPLVYALARRLNIPEGQREDVIQAGLLGLVQAADRFDPDRGVRFSSYAVPVILGEMRDCLRKFRSTHAGRRGQMQAAQLLALEEKMTARLGRCPSLRELAAEADLSAEDAAALLGALLPPKPVEDEENRLPAENPEETTVRTLDARRALLQLSPRAQRLIRLRFFENRTQQQTAAALNTSQSQISRLEQRTLAQLRGLLAEE